VVYIEHFIAYPRISANKKINIYLYSLHGLAEGDGIEGYKHLE